MSDAERESLEALSRKRAAQSPAERARVVLACAEEGGVAAPAGPARPGRASPKAASGPRVRPPGTTTTTGRQIPNPLSRTPYQPAVQFGSHQMCSVVVSDLNGFQFVTHKVTAVPVYPAGVAEIAEFELPKLGPPILLN